MTPLAALMTLSIAASDAGPVDFVRQVRPILERNCYRCHGPTRRESGFRLDSVRAIVAGGDSGPAVVAGKSAQSRLIAVLQGTGEGERMPLEAEPLSPAEVALLARWIDEGARGPETDEPDRVPSDHWAFQPPVRPLPPPVNSPRWPRDPIDSFILARLERQAIDPAPQADRATLLRRLWLDLLGLPPPIDAVDDFLADPHPDAYERSVDRLLASPHFGERGGRHWLDLARYADSNGYNADAPRPIWKYRDWVIDALNRDLPFDRFTVEQIAGDLVPAATTEQKVATGFHRNTLFNQEGGNDPEQYRIERVVDRVSTTGTVFLGLTIGCSECHSHKFDPISQREYYELFAFFNEAEETTLELPTPEELAQRQAIRPELAKLGEALKAHDEAAAARQPAWEAGAGGRVSKEIAELLQVPRDERTPEQQKPIQAAYQADDAARKELVERIDAAKKREPKVVSTLVMSQPSNLRPTHVHIRGDFLRPGERVSPNVPRVLPPLVSHSPTGHATRLDLGQWLVGPRNPLTARVTVNRIWLQLFGAGLVETENDFGTQGESPSHPQLLDWLADEFVARGWSCKPLYRRIVTSAAYRQSSRQRPELEARDPANRLLARQARLRVEAEVVRDLSLAASGLLWTPIGGPGVFPYQPAGVMDFRRAKQAWTPSEGGDGFRRGMYTHFWRTSPHPFLIAFDAPKTDVTCTRRVRSNTPLQALQLLNDPAFRDCAGALARRVMREGPTSPAARLEYAFRLCLAREPDSSELAVLEQFYWAQLGQFENDRTATAAVAGAGPATEAFEPVHVAAWSEVARVLLNLDEFITRE